MLKFTSTVSFCIGTPICKGKELNSKLGWRSVKCNNIAFKNAICGFKCSNEGTLIAKGKELNLKLVWRSVKGNDYCFQNCNYCGFKCSDEGDFENNNYQ